MTSVVTRPLRFALQTARRAIESTETGRNLLMDVKNNNEFRSLLVHEQMLGDTVRVNTYREGIRRQVRPGDVVVDLGTGTGVLAMFAAQQGANVYAIDHADIIELAQRIGQHNGLHNIRYVQQNSRDFSCPEPVDVVIHEQLGCAMFDENMVENLLDLKRRILKPGGRILPGTFELFVEPVSLLPGRSTPRIWEQQIEGIDYRFLRDPRERRGLEEASPDHYVTDLSAPGCLLGEPRPVLTVDLNGIESADEIPRQFEVTRDVVNPGAMHGAVVYFRAIFDDDLALDTMPFQALTPWSWSEYHIFRTPVRDYALGDTVSYRFNMGRLADVLSWSVEVQEHLARPAPASRGAA